MGGLRARRERVTEIIACDTIPGASEIHRGHAVVLRRCNGKQLLVLLLFAGRSELSVQLIKSRAGKTAHVRTRLGPSETGWAWLDHGNSVGNHSLLGNGGSNAGIFEDAVENLSGSSANLVRHARNGRGGRTGRLACDESTAQEQHEQEARGNGFLLVFATGHNGKGLLLGLLARSLLIKVVDEDVVVPFAVAHVEVVHVGGEVGESRAGRHGGRVVGGALKPLGENGDLLAKLTGLEGVGANKLLLVEVKLIDELVHFHLLTMPILFLC